MTATLRTTATLEPRGPAAAFLLTDEQVSALGGDRKAFPVTLRVNGVQLRLRLARMGGENVIGLARAVRDQAGVSIGASYDVEIAPDEGARVVEVPQDLATALAGDPAAAAAFAALSFTHRKEFVRWVEEAKRDATRADRVARIVEMVREGRTR